MGKTNTCTVYALSSSEDGRVRYVGQTQMGIKQRLSQHLSEAKRSDYKVSRWIRKTVENGFQVQITPLEERAILHEAEVRWIALYRRSHSDLTNTSMGGDFSAFGLVRSEETKERMRGPKSQSHRMSMMVPKSADTKLKMSLAQIGNSKSRGELNRHAKLTLEKVRDVKSMLNDGLSLSKIAAIVGVKKAAVSKIKTGRNWSFVV